VRDIIFTFRGCNSLMHSSPPPPCSWVYLEYMWTLDTPTSSKMVTSPTARNRWLTLSMGIMTASFLSFTIFFAYNCSSNNPYISLLVFQRPETSILILTVAVQLTIFSLAEFTSAVLDATRWALACSSSGTSALTFLALSRATNFIGAIYLTCTGNGQGGLRIWGSQRYI